MLLFKMRFWRKISNISMFGKVIIKDEMSKEILSSMNLPIACCSAVAHLLKLGWCLFTKITGNV